MTRFGTLVLLRKLLAGCIVAWAITATIAVATRKDKTVVIGIDDYGTRLITGDDRILEKEKLHFIRHYLELAYNYEGQDYSSRISEAGSLMSDQLWAAKKEEFSTISEKMKSSDLRQESRITDIRMVEPTTYEADLKLVIFNKLKRTDVTFRVEIKLQPHKRTSENPYAWEVLQYAETQI
jgi:hypothetical protein